MAAVLVVGLGPTGVALTYDVVRQRTAVARETACRAIAIAQDGAFPLRVQPEVTEVHLTGVTDEQVSVERLAALGQRWTEQAGKLLEAFAWDDDAVPRVLVVANPSDREVVTIGPVVALLRSRLPAGARFTGILWQLSPEQVAERTSQMAYAMARVQEAGLDQVVFCAPPGSAGNQALAWVLLEMWLAEPLGSGAFWQTAHVLAVTEDEKARDMLAVAARLTRQRAGGAEAASQCAARLQEMLPAGPNAGETRQILVSAGGALRQRFPGWEPVEAPQASPANGYLVLKRSYENWAHALGLAEVPAAPEPAAASPAAAEAAAAVDAPESPEPEEAHVADANEAPETPAPGGHGAAEAPAQLSDLERQIRNAVVMALFDLDALDLPPVDLQAWANETLQTMLAEDRMQEAMALGRYALEQKILTGAAGRHLQVMLDEAMATVPAQEREMFERLVAAMTKVVGTPADDFTRARGVLGRRLIRNPQPPTA